MNLVTHSLALLLTLIVQVRMVKLIIDTDGVSDDIRAISLAMQHPDVEMIAFTTTHGCVNVSQATANVARTQRANGLENLIPIYQGCTGPLIGKDDPDDESFFFGKDGLGDVPDTFPQVLPTDFTASEREHASLALIRLTKEHPDVTLVCLGPLTNIALALKLDPEFASRPNKMVLMGGNYLGIGNVHSYSSSEYNFYGDPEAASVVLREMKCNVTIVPWEAFYLEGEQHEKEVDFNKHMLYDTTLAKYLHNITGTGRKALEKNGRQFAFCDEIAVATAIAPETVVKQQKRLRATVELAGKYSRGQLVVDWTEIMWSQEDSVELAECGKQLCRKRRTLTFVTSYDVHAVNQMMHNTTRNAKNLPDLQNGYKIVEN